MGFAVGNLVKPWQTFTRNSPKPYNHHSSRLTRPNLISHASVFKRDNKSFSSLKLLLPFTNYSLFTKGLRPEHQQVKYEEMIQCVGGILLCFIVDSLSWSNDYLRTGWWTANINLRIRCNSLLIPWNNERKTLFYKRQKLLFAVHILPAKHNVYDRLRVALPATVLITATLKKNKKLTYRNLTEI